MKLNDMEAQEAAKAERLAAHTSRLDMIHTSGTSLSQARGDGRGAKSLVCYRPEHKVQDCRFTWCDCECHKAETDAERLDRALGRIKGMSAIVQAARELK